MSRLRYLGRLLGELVEFAWQNKAWWIVPIVLVLFLLMAFVVAGGGLTPYLYPLY